MRKLTRLFPWLMSLFLIGILTGGYVMAQSGGFGDWSISEQSDTRIVLERDAVDVPPTETPVPPTPTDEPDPQELAVWEVWHVPGAHVDGAGNMLNAHEHGAKPPAFADTFSMEHFGHPVMYGGDERTPNENVHPDGRNNKHIAFKGYDVTFDGVRIFFRTHMQANPMGHMARFHSYEVYALDQAGNVSFWQGHLDFGHGNATGPLVRDGNCEDSSPRPIMGVNKLGCDPYTFESWYSRPGGVGFWTWDTGVNTQAPYYHDAADPMDISTWNRAPDGNHGLTRRVELSWYADRASAVPRDTWFCAEASGQILGFADGNSPDGCAEGLPQYIAGSMTTVSFPGNSSQTEHDGAGVVQQPN